MLLMKAASLLFNLKPYSILPHFAEFHFPVQEHTMSATVVYFDSAIAAVNVVSALDVRGATGHVRRQVKAWLWFISKI